MIRFARVVAACPSSKKEAEAFTKGGAVSYPQEEVQGEEEWAMVWLFVIQTRRGLC